MGCQGTWGGCSGGRGAAAAPRAAAQPCGPAVRGGCSPRCSRRCPRCAGTVGDGGFRGGPGSTRPPHTGHPLLTQHLQSAGSGCPSRPRDSPAGTRQGVKRDRTDSAPLHPNCGGPMGNPTVTHPLTPVLHPAPSGRVLGDRRAGGWLPPTPCPSPWPQGSVPLGTHLLQRLCQLGTENDDVPTGRKVIQGGEQVPGGAESSAPGAGAPSTHGCPHFPPRPVEPGEEPLGSPQQVDDVGQEGDGGWLGGSPPR